MPQAEDLLFTFAVMGDSHLKPAEGDESSPFATNLLANERNRHAARLLERLAPDFVVHMGDLVHPVPALPTYAAAARLFEEIFGGLEMPLYSIPGNHDVGDKAVAWMPAHLVSEEGIASYREQFGPPYQAFEHRGCHFIFINAPVLNSGLPSEEEQRDWLERELASTPELRKFLFLHYPPYLLDPAEEGHYDNLDEPARSWILSLLERHGVEALFAGHVHNFFYNRHGPTDMYVLPSLTFVRNDFSELFKVEAGAENGRNDVGKLGFFLVDVFRDGYGLRFVRTYGRTEEEPEGPVELAASARRTGQAASTPVGVDLRHPWAEVVELPFNYILEEFSRKRVRNDYPLLGLWDLGISKLRVPWGDITVAGTRARMADLQRAGQRFQLFTFGVPNDIESLVEHAHLLDAWEVIVPSGELDRVLPELKRVRERTGLRVFLSRLETSAERGAHGSRFDHFVQHGFRIADLQGRLDSFREAADGVTGLVFRIGPESSPWAEIMELEQAFASRALSVSTNVQLASNNEAEPVRDDTALACRVAETVVASRIVRGLESFLDTFADVDRGYFVRNGLVDRRYNPRLAGRVFRHLTAALEAVQENPAERRSGELAGGRLCQFSCNGRSYGLLLPYRDALVIEELEIAALAGGAGEGHLLDLDTGRTRGLTWRRREGEGVAGHTVLLSAAVRSTVPALLVLEQGRTAVR